MLVVMSRKATEHQLEQVKQYLVENDCDFHQSTGADRTILGVVGDTRRMDRDELAALSGVLEVFRIPAED
ncbi:MAG: hypothetical protein C0618_04705 [Desulfuromonas sp.]|nr:MAG: hypothetical protein C0618_04705 [Desulfuromonas sp.]